MSFELKLKRALMSHFNLTEENYQDGLLRLDANVQLFIASFKDGWMHALKEDMETQRAMGSLDKRRRRPPGACF